jgi:hypothetical protein
MKNKYPGTCARCSMLVSANAGTVEKRDGRWLVYHDECPEITSGLGIGGIGSDDYNIRNTGEPPVGRATAPNRTPGIRGFGTRYDEPCEACHRVTEVCNDCGCCAKHCTCR